MATTGTVPESTLAWFRRTTWLGIWINWAFALPALCFPEALAAVLGMGGLNSTIWLRNAGLLVALLTLFYIPAARDPVGLATIARRSVLARFLAGAFWLILIWCLGEPSILYLFAAGDLGVGLLQLLTLHPVLHPASGAGRGAWRRSLTSAIFSAFWRGVNKIVQWDKLPSFFVGPFNLLALRNDLREWNLHDTSGLPSNDHCDPLPAPLEYRSPEGTFVDKQEPKMGAAGTRFGRNVPLDQAWPQEPPELLTPSPREVSRRLLTRDQFQPATTLNLLAAAWIQFENHDWFNHKRNDSEAPEDFFEIPLEPGDEWPTAPGPMKIRKTPVDPSRPADSAGPPTYINTETHWWDGSQIYGSHRDTQKLLRTGEGGKMKLLSNGLLPLDPTPKMQNGIDLTGFNDNYWIGLSLLHTLFVKEHNAICDMLHAEFPSWDDERLFQTARLVNAALMAKIHTVEWTPGILGHPSLQVSMRANWWGLLGEAFKKRFGRLSSSEAISGIPGSPQEHHAAPYYLTEEFVAVYRLHPLIPDDLTIRALADDQALRDYNFMDVQGVHTRPVIDKHGLSDLYYSFGRMHPGAITLHNFPKALQQFRRINGDVMDLGAVDVLRDRERGVPRYNQFRQSLRKAPITSFEAMTENPEWAKELKAVYEHVDRVDTMVGMFAEPVPKGFGFSDTAFRVFILMASRRLKSDRFLTDDFSPKIYSEPGFQWVENTTMTDVLLRHHPELKPALAGVANPFAPWKSTAKT